jgi:hypothetical protein
MGMSTMAACWRCQQTAQQDAGEVAHCLPQDKKKHKKSSKHADKEKKEKHHKDDKKSRKEAKRDKVSITMEDVL